MKYKIEFSRPAEKQLADIQKNELKKIANKIDKLALNPFPEGHEKLKGHENIYRIRQGDYRVLYSVFENKLTILVIKIGHRREIYR